MPRTLPINTLLRLVLSCLLPAALSSSLGAQTTASATDPSTFLDESGEEVIILDEFKVESTSSRDTYMTSDVASAARVAAKATETPYSVQVMTSEFINDFQLFETADQLRMVSGAFAGAEDTGANNGKRIRGFQPMVLRDGFSRANPPDRSVVDRVEIIRGPVSMLYGQSSPGGLINYISKRAKKKPAYSLSATYGPDYDFKRVALDATGPIVRNKLFYYLNYSYNYNESDTEYFYNEKNLYAGGLTWNIAPTTLLTISWESQRISSNQADTIPMLRVGNVFVDTYWDLAHFNLFGPHSKLHRDFDSANILFEHRFTGNLTARLNLQYYEKTFDQNKIRLGPGSGSNSFVEDTPSRGQFTRLKQDEYAYLAQADVLYKLQTGPVRHMFLLAGDYSTTDHRQLFSVQNGAEFGGAGNGFGFFEVNPWNPVWIKPPPLSELNKTWQDTDRNTDNYGALLSWRMFLFSDQLVTLAGVRYDRVDQGLMLFTDYQSPARSTDRSGTTADDITYSLGFNWKLFGDDRTVFYFNHSTGFEPTVFVDRGTGQVMPNETSFGFETGLKGSLFADQLGYTLSLFSVEKRDANIETGLAGAGANGIPVYYIGKEEAKGVELDLRWNVTDAFFIQAGGAYVDSKVTEPENKRDRLIKAPRTNGYLATRYVFRTGSLKGFKLGAKATYTGSYLHHAGSVNTNTGVVTRFRQVNPSVALYDAFAGYSFATKSPTRLRHSVTLNVLNIFDKYYLQDTYRLARGREVRLTYTLSY
ncbi:TonB-dependent receptor plug domain-containing protein [Termitidicoccus mucosus]|uniref:TonB-dependent receptor plug domain-containing protein n=1 Tax=Termitidicoccus mucosus TaxID=1184151 RepID=A0A178IGS0_9BACT|nr:hypothetical protein AW736_17415 [Opitutaceae bacterium TSB47]